MRRLHMEEMTSAEIERAVDDGYRIAIVPLGSIEAHGPQLPVGTDSILARHVAGLVAARVPYALVAPTITLGYLPRTRFPGSISVPVSVVFEILRSYCRALSRDGFECVAFLPMHGEHFQTLALLAPELGLEFQDLTLVAGVDLVGFLELRNEIAARYGITPLEAGWHAGAAETSELLALDAELVRAEKSRLGYLGPSGFADSSPETLRRGWVALDPEAVMGDPRKADAEFGREILDALAQFLASAIERGRGNETSHGRREADQP